MPHFTRSLILAAALLAPALVADATGPALDAGTNHTCALLAGEVRCWGWNWEGELGDGTTRHTNVPQLVTSLPVGIEAVGTGSNHTCALSDAGGVLCWGGGGSLGDGTSNDSFVPVPVTGLASGVVSIAVGSSHTCARSIGGAISCWGANYYGKLGDGTTTDRLAPVAVSGLPADIVAISAGFYHTCAAASSGGVWCWGRNSDGQLGDGTNTHRSLPTPVTGLPGPVAALAAGSAHTCALTTVGEAWCWGANGASQLGDGTTTGRTVPTPVVGLPPGVAAIDAGYVHSCALSDSGGAWCWGGNASGQLGDGTTTGSSVPLPVPGLSGGVSAIAVGQSHTCVLTSGGGACWGSNQWGQLGDGGPFGSGGTPTQVVGLASGITAIALGSSHACALTVGGGVHCWGDNWAGALGNGTTTRSSVPVPVTGLASGVTALGAGGAHTCAASAGGQALCWGSNASGQLGDGTTNDSLVPVPVSGLSSGVVRVGVGNSHTCATAGGDWCWGYNEYGQLGASTPSWTQKTPVALPGAASTTIAAGLTHTCASSPTHDITCWGDNRFGQAGPNAVYPFSHIEAPVTSGITVAVGETHSCALTNAGGVVCWGANDRGQLGNGVDGGPSWSPVPVTNLSSDVTAISAANDHSCALRAGGDVWCWGNNFGGQLGDGTTLDSNVPVSVALLPGDVVAIGSGSFYNCALTARGEVWCWGDGSTGELGDGRLFESLVPVPVAGLSSPQVPTLGTSAGLVLFCVLVAVAAAAHRRRVIPLRS